MVSLGGVGWYCDWELTLRFSGGTSNILCFELIDGYLSIW